MMKQIRQWIQAHKYAWILLYIPCYLAYFAWLQSREPAAVHMIVSPLDAYIPTIPAFFLPYAVWWLLFPGAIAYFLFVSKEDFLKLCFVMFTGYTICLFVYTVFPNGLDLREELQGNDLFSRGILWLRSIDPPRNVCPSMHVSSTVAIDLTVRRSKCVPRIAKHAVTVTALLINLSTMFIKQHSVIDVLWGMGMSIALFVLYEFYLARRKPV